MKYLIIISILFINSSVFGQADDYREVHFSSIVIDAHNDVVHRITAGEDISKLTRKGHSDIPRFKEGGVDVEICSIWVPPGEDRTSYFDKAGKQIDAVEAFVRRNPDVAGLAYSSKQIQQLVSECKFVVMLGLEGGHPLMDSVENLDFFYSRGIRYLTLTWNNSTSWAASARDEERMLKKQSKTGLSPLGLKIVERMNKIGMIIDVSHLGEKSFWDVMRTTKRPIIASHSSVWELCRNTRNLKDDQLKAIAENGGLVCVNFAPFFIDSSYSRKEKKIGESRKLYIDSLRADKKGQIDEKSVDEYFRKTYEDIRPPIAMLIDHIEYLIRLIGIEHVGLGSDFDGISAVPQEMDDVSDFPNITRELIKRGYKVDGIKKVLGLNFMRVLQENEKE